MPKYIDLKKENFDGDRIVLPGRVPGMLLAHAEWCGHCTRFMPTYAELARDLKCNFYRIGHKDLNEGNLGKTLGIKSFPTLYIVDANGCLEKYNGGREKADILKGLCAAFHKK